MKGKSKIEGLTSEWYGFTVFSFLVNGLLALFGTGVFAVVAVPLVIGFAVIALAINWGIGRLLINKSSLTRIVLLVLQPIGIVCGGLYVWELVTGPWSIGMALNMLVAVAGTWMYVHSFMTLLDKDVRAYFR